MQINFTKLYRLWFLLTTLSVFGLFSTYFVGYNPAGDLWIESLHNIHTLFVGMLSAAVIIRIYMALNGINGVPMVHLIRAKNIKELIIALGYIMMCSALLITLGSEIYLLVVSQHEAAPWLRKLRNATQPVFAAMVLLHIAYVLYLNLLKQKGSLRRLLFASDAH